MADDDIGSAYLKHHMTEAQSNAPGSFGDKSGRGARQTTDSDIEGYYGKSVDLSPNATQVVNRRGKGNKL